MIEFVSCLALIFGPVIVWLLVANMLDMTAGSGVWQR